MLLLLHRLVAIDNLIENNKFVPILCKNYCLSHHINNIQLEYCYYIEFYDSSSNGNDNVGDSSNNVIVGGIGKNQGDHDDTVDRHALSSVSSLSANDIEKILWLLSETFEPQLIHINKSFFNHPINTESNSSSSINDDSTSNNNNNQTNSSEPIGNGDSLIIECGPRLAFSTAWSSNCLSMFHACGITCISRIERSRRYRLKYLNLSSLPFSSSSSSKFTKADVDYISSFLYDRMTEFIYTEPLQSFNTSTTSTSSSSSSHIIPLLENGINELIKINQLQGLGFDQVDLEFYYNIFINILKRNPTDVECFDLGQSNSEHSRHWFFNGTMIIDHIEKQETLFQIVKSTLPKKISKENENINNDNAQQQQQQQQQQQLTKVLADVITSTNSVIAFHDNSSAIYGYHVQVLVPSNPTTASSLQLQDVLLHPILTAETHNFPCGVAPFPGAETGTGGRLRDVQATGRGAHTVAGISSYCVGNLQIPSYSLPWEDSLFEYPTNLASPLRIIVEASNGASDYGNKYGEPVVSGFTRSFGQKLPNGERVEWLKPIMFTAGVGMLDDRHSSKNSPEVGMIVCKVGGPAYRIGMGGGAASSRVQGTADENLDFNAVQRGDAEMENRMNRVIRACVELGDNNPIVSIHDQGAGGNGNVLKEIVDPLGARLYLKKIPKGDKTLTAMELWGAEYQENNAILVKPEDLAIILAISDRENCPVSPVGTITGDGRVVVEAEDGSTPVDLPLSLVLGKMPQKRYFFRTSPKVLLPLKLPVNVTIEDALSRVLRLVDVGSKRFLTNKVDRSVTGLVAQQSCVGPLHIPLADVAVLAQSHFSTTGVAVAVGEQPIKGLISNSAQARLTVCEALSNLVFAEISKLEDVKASCNWMWAAKFEGEGAKMYEACSSLRDCLVTLGVGIDGGKDSLSMAAKVKEETVKSPGQVTLTCYAPCTNINHTITPDFKSPGKSAILYIDLGEGHYRLGGTAFSTVYGQIGDECPDISAEGLIKFKACFQAIQECIQKGLIQAGHDRSDGGLIVTLLEMAFAGNCGINIQISEQWKSKTQLKDIGNESVDAYFPILFGEELGFILEVLDTDIELVKAMFINHDVLIYNIGVVTEEKNVMIRYTSTADDDCDNNKKDNNDGDDGDEDVDDNKHEVANESIVNVKDSATEVIFEDSMVKWRDVWESTSFELEKLQCNISCVTQEQLGLKNRSIPPFHVTFSNTDMIPSAISSTRIHKVAILRQEGTNGDREMTSAFYRAGFDVWDINMHDLLTQKITLDQFKGIVFCGGFSYADVNDSAKGWAGVIKFNNYLWKEFENFRQRNDTFSLGVCNGCQLMALLGWVPFPDNKVSIGGVNESFPPSKQARFIHNSSNRFESRWSTVKILPSPAVLLKDMEGSTLSVWVAHGEGKAFFPEERHLQLVQGNNLAPIRYVDDENEVTEKYPFNPNGSPLGIAALCSPDGRHLALMPHPERAFLKWQLPYLPRDLKGSYAEAPWLKLFLNALHFCDAN